MIRQDSNIPEPENLVLQPRNVTFDWTGLPTHWVPNEPLVTHTINVLHLLLPAGETWFVDVFTQAIPLIKDDKLRDEVLGFIGQETLHARSHQGVLDHWKAKSIDTDPYVQQVGWMFQKALGDRDLPATRREEWLIERLSIIAAIEHITATLGNWALNATALDAADADPTMLDLLRWHGAEEVEHRAVAFDLFTHLDGRYLRRVRAMLITAPIMLWLWVRGVAFLMRIDPELGGRVKPRWRHYFRASRRRLLPSAHQLIWQTLNYARPSYHPSQEFSTGQAVTYLAKSPAATAAAV
ncbi:MAG TPA: metal-dependent hydrolase [Pseudonocardiaceae bacterium]|jgi:predicted metal-dependent hydrolase|nr:metal-dependent hydrolase [Pseudonocardiaceae bacterium]